MKTLNEIKKLLAEHMETLRDKYKIQNIGVFDSFVRGKQKKEATSQFSN